MSVERLRHGAAIAVLVVLDQRRRAHEDPWNAEAALHPTLEHERFGEDAARLIGKAFERDDIAAVHLFRLAEAGQRRGAIDLHQTAAAGPLRRAAVLRREGAALRAQDLEEVHPGLVMRFGRCAV